MHVDLNHLSHSTRDSREQRPCAVSLHSRLICLAFDDDADRPRPRKAAAAAEGIIPDNKSNPAFLPSESFCAATAASFLSFRCVVTTESQLCMEFSWLGGSLLDCNPYIRYIIREVLFIPCHMLRLSPILAYLRGTDNPAREDECRSRDASRERGERDKLGTR